MENKNEVTKENLPVKLTDDELRAYGDELAILERRKTEAESEKKAFNSQIKSRIDGFISQIQELSAKIEQRREWREVECVNEFDYDKKTVTVTRKDTGTVVRTRGMSEYEMQQELFNEPNA